MLRTLYLYIAIFILNSNLNNVNKVYIIFIVSSKFTYCLIHKVYKNGRLAIFIKLLDKCKLEIMLFEMKTLSLSLQ